MTADAPRRPAGPKLDWSCVPIEAFLDPANFARVLAGLDFTRHYFKTPRETLDCWPPEYVAWPRTSPHRPMVAASNRTRRDAEVHFVSDATTLFMIEAWPPGPWRTKDAAQRGDDLISLGMLRWSCNFGQAAFRIARLIGMRSIPTAQSIAPGDLFKGASFAPAAALPAEQNDA